MDGRTGDPASCSQLGGALRSESARLLAVRNDLDAALSGRSRAASSEVMGRRAGGEVHLLDTIAVHLDAAGTLLQHYAQELAQVAESTRRLETEVAHAGLEMEGLRILEPWGVAQPDAAARRRAALPELQMRADRLASQLGRARAAVQRTMAASGDVLGRAAAAARAGLET